MPTETHTQIGPKQQAVFPQTVYAVAVLYENTEKLQYLFSYFVIRPGISPLTSEQAIAVACEEIGVMLAGQIGAEHTYKPVFQTASWIVQEKSD